MSLPHRLGICSTESALHGAAPYLRPPAGLVDDWRRRMRADIGRKVGLVWAGSSRHHSPQLAAIDARRNVPPERLLPLLSLPGCTFFSLQKGNHAARAWTGPGAAAIRDFSGEWRDFSDTAAVIANLDLVISVDTAVAHLAGAMGKPVWLLNRYDTCWRWMLERSDSPWYSSLRLFRQSRPGDWEPVIAAAAAALADLTASHIPPR